MPTRTVKSIALAVTLATWSIACTPASSLNHEVAATPQDTFLTINNNNWSDMKVYALVGGVRFRLGTVTSMGRTRVRIPPSFLGHTSELRLALEPIGGRMGYVTEGIYVDAGTRLECTIQNNLRLSTLWIRG
jgi:hypothetical protein